MFSFDTICNKLSSLLIDIVRFLSVMYCCQPLSFKIRLLWRDFHTLIMNVSFSLAHHPMFSFDIIYNNSSSLVLDIVRFSLLCIAVNLLVLKYVYYGEIFTLIRNVSFSLAHDPMFSFDTICNNFILANTPPNI